MNLPETKKRMSTDVALCSDRVQHPHPLQTRLLAAMILILGNEHSRAAQLATQIRSMR